MSHKFLKFTVVIFFIFLIVLLFWYFLTLRKLSIVENNVSVAKKQPQTYTPMLSKSGDDPILQTLVDEADIIAHVKIKSIDGGEVKKLGVVEFIANAEAVQLYKAPFQMKGDLLFGFNRLAYLTQTIQAGENFFKDLTVEERKAVEQGKEYIVFLTSPASAGVGGGVFLTYHLSDRFLGVQPYDKYLEERIKTYLPQDKGATPLEKSHCANLVREIQTMLDEANYCTQDSDCIISTQVHLCEVTPCYSLLHKNTNIGNIQKSLSNYWKKHCAIITDCSCNELPQQNEIKCINSKCVDVRLFAE